jgi:hypothetical protein
MGLDLRTIRRPFVAVPIRERLLRLLIKALMGSSNAAGF